MHNYRFEKFCFRMIHVVTFKIFPLLSFFYVWTVWTNGGKPFKRLKNQISSVSSSSWLRTIDIALFDSSHCILLPRCRITKLTLLCLCPLCLKAVKMKNVAMKKEQVRLLGLSLKLPETLRYLQRTLFSVVKTVTFNFRTSRCESIILSKPLYVPGRQVL